MPLTFVGFIYINSWVVSLFVVLPFFVRSQAETGREGYVAAPRAIVWRRALLINSLVSVAVTGFMVWLIQSGLVDVKNLV